MGFELNVIRYKKRKAHQVTDELFAEWTGLELCPYIVEFQCFYFLKTGCSPDAHLFFATN
jgi:hypothetical protein